MFTLAAAIFVTVGAKSPVAEGAVLQRLGTGFAFTEGPAADREGNVFFTDQPNDRIMRWGIDGRITEWMKPAGRSNGMAFDRQGNLVACADGDNELWSIDRERKPKALLRDFQGKRLNGPNDVWIRPDGGLFFTDPLYPRPYWKRDPASEQGGQNVYFLSRKGVLKAVETSLKQPNGITGTRDGRTLYVSDIGDGKTYRYRVSAAGDLTDRTLFCTLGSDGMTVDDEGNVYLTGRGVTIFDRTGSMLQHVEVPEGWTANVTFGGKDRRMLFITASKSVYGLRMRTRGIE